MCVRADGEAAGAAASGGAPASAAAAPVVVVKRPAVLADGTYATQTAVEAAPVAPGLLGAGAPNLRSLLLVSARGGGALPLKRLAEAGRMAAEGTLGAMADVGRSLVTLLRRGGRGEGGHGKRASARALRVLCCGCRAATFSWAAWWRARSPSCCCGSTRSARSAVSLALCT